MRKVILSMIIGLFLALPCYATDTIISDIGSDPGDDYSTLAAWWTAKAGNLVTADQIQIAECRGELHARGTDAVITMTSGTATTDATHYYVIRPMTGAYFRGDFDNVASVARFTSTNSIALTIDISYTRVYGILVSGNSGGGVRREFYAASATNLLLDGVGIYNCSASGLNLSHTMAAIEFGSSNTYQIRNCAINNMYSNATGTTSGKTVKSYGFFGTTSSASGLIYNTTITNIIADNDDSGSDCHASAWGIFGCPTVTNTLAMLTVATAANGTPTAADFSTITTQSYNASEDTTSDGTGSIDSVTPTDEITDTSTTTCDVHLKTGADCLLAATDLSASFTTDIDGDTRDAGYWDIGADQKSTAPAPTGYGQVI